MTHLLIIAGLIGGCGVDERPMVVLMPDGVTHEIQSCGGGCSAPTADEQRHLADDELAALLDEVAEAPLAAPTLALETLLFHRSDTLAYLARNGSGTLESGKAAWLWNELERDEVTVEMRLIDEDGALRGHLEERVLLVDKQHLRLADTGALGRLAINGKVKRVGVDHLWARF